MDSVTQIMEGHTAGPQSLGFDYQFYYFMLLALELKHGQKIGFEVKDDIHIDKEDGTTILFQAKHTIQSDINSKSANLTTLDADLWKTLSNWTIMAKADASILSTHSFCLITNKNQDNNMFLDALATFRENKDVAGIIECLGKLGGVTKDAEIKQYLKNVISLGKKNLKLFCTNLSVATSTDDIITKVKNKIHENIRKEELVDAIFEKLSSNLQQAKYIEIKARKKFEVSFEDFNKRFGGCFTIAFKDKSLPKRRFLITLPKNLEDQLFIKQLLDIREIEKDSAKIIDYTGQMLQAINNLSSWVENSLVLPTELTEFERNALLKWENEFRSKYRHVEKKIQKGATLLEVEDEIQNLACELVDLMRRENLPIAGDSLGIELSNGHYYALSNELQIGWHFDWATKYRLP
jgi:hypothetical protein